MTGVRARVTCANVRVAIGEDPELTAIEVGAAVS